MHEYLTELAGHVIEQAENRILLPTDFSPLR